MITVHDFKAFESIMEYLDAVPFNVTPRQLYSALALYNRTIGGGGTEASADDYDQQVYRHFLRLGKNTCYEQERLARALHDCGIEQALNDFLNGYDRRCVVGVMGGHGMLRTDAVYREIVLLGKTLTEQHSLMVTGGGPGAMEATHLGAWMAGRTLQEVDQALAMLAVAPTFKHAQWLPSALQVMARFPQTRYESLGIPTWLYGHEPSTPFATRIAKFFDNSIREDTVLTIAYGGIVYTPGSAGTMQEIFQDAVQNHYLSFGIASPMVFLGRQFWQREMPVYPFLQQMVAEGKYKNLILSITDTASQAADQVLGWRAVQRPC